MISYIITFLFDSSLLLSTQVHKKDKNVSQQAWWKNHATLKKKIDNNHETDC